MDWLTKVVAIWLSIDILVIATMWYAPIALKRLWPNWWRETVVDTIEPDFVKIAESELKRETLSAYSKIWQI